MYRRFRLVPVKLSPRGQSGLEAKILASALNVWPRPRPRPRSFGQSMASALSSNIWPRSRCLVFSSCHMMEQLYIATIISAINSESFNPTPTSSQLDKLSMYYTLYAAPLLWWCIYYFVCRRFLLQLIVFSSFQE